MTALFRGLLACAAVALATSALATPAPAQPPATSSTQPAPSGTGVITGRVLDRGSQQPLAGAQVVLIGTTRGTLTNDQGVYRIAGVPAGAHPLRALRIGYAATSQIVSVTAGQTTTADFGLNATAVTLDVVSVTATGNTIRQRETGNTVATIAPTTSELAAAGNITDVLNSRAPSVYVQQASGSTGTGSRIRIRGANSISLSNEPLLIIDGVRANNDVGDRQVPGGGPATNVSTAGQVVSRLNDLNPEDIESIDVIRGPAGVALYGTAAANGVIQVTTKRGRAGRTVWSAFGETGSLKQTTDFPSNYGALGTFASNGRRGPCTIDSRTRGLCTVDHIVSLNPLRDNSPFRTGERFSGGGSVSGGTERTTFYVSGDVQREAGVQQTNNDRRTDFRANVRADLRDNWNVQVNTGYVGDRLQLPVNDNSVLGLLSVALLGRPLSRDSLSGGFFSGFTPDILENLSIRQRTDRFLTSVTTNAQLLPWLGAAGVLGLDYFNQVSYQAIQPNRVGFGDLPQGSADSDPMQNYNYTAQGSLNATFHPSASLTSTSQVGGQYSRVTFHGTNAFGAVLTPGTSSLSGTSARFAVSEFNTDNVLLGAFVQQQLAWRDRLFVTGAVRGDRNSAFGQNLGFVWYPSVNASWVLSDEPFFPRVPGLSSARVRAAYGRSGQKPDFRNAITYYSPYAVRVSGQEVGAISFANGGLGDPALKPERTGETEAGADLGFLNGRVSAQLTYYTKRTDDALVQLPVAPSVGSVAQRFQNLGSLRNRGFEVQLSGKLLDTRPLGVELTVGGSTNDNELLNLGAGVSPITFNAGAGAVQQHRPGYPAGGYWAVPYTFADANHDGMIARSEVTAGDTTVYLGNPLPRREWQLTPAVTLFQRLRVQALVSHRAGYKVYNLTERYRCVLGNCLAIADPTAPLADQARAIAAAVYGTDAGFVEDGSFTKLRELTFTLSASPRIARMLRTSAASFTVAGRNLWLSSKYTGFDPEITSTPGSNFTSADFLTVPPVRTWTARLNLTF
ncbi:TonB-dependent outer membrane protein, SusC/RagA [Gemmatirosa kalamazoonensis]|uniref:TonB-dependent outer membrane protein, SusC/RagA n=1 Tax=Gemmatirosa kalamazoonensis TaxID=861299 RepID=W0RE38_9BACT|nr:SusC/RagA family TonB-linked outer membrane protein [Gemmatirosa kalamazoonensis]AHG89359.1 TonB-dependent outer membrane protein, SusC/RagA [Gemmatirosa kalamazoonensis]